MTRAHLHGAQPLLQLLNVGNMRSLTGIVANLSSLYITVATQLLRPLTVNREIKFGIYPVYSPLSTLDSVIHPSDMVVFPSPTEIYGNEIQRGASN